MVLSSFPETARQKWAERSQSKEWQEAFHHLHQGDYTLYLSVSPSDNSVLYEAYSPSLPLLGVRVSLDKTLESPYQDHMGLDDGDYALLCYIDEKEAKESEETLRNRYGASYDTLSRIVSFSPAQRKQYLQGKSDLGELVNQLRSSPNLLEPSWVKPSLTFEFRFTNGVSILPVVLGEGRHRLRSIPSFLAQVKQGSAIHDGRGGYLRLDLDSFSTEDQKIIYHLSNEVASDPYYWHEDENSAAALFLLCAGKEVLVDEQSLRVDDKPTEAEVQIDDNGTISLQGVPESRQAFFYRDGAALILTKLKRVALFHFQSPASAALCRFVLDHPHFPYSALQEEIGADLLPLLKQKDAHVSPAFEEKSRSVRTCIAYYLDYEEEGKNGVPTLSMKTEFHSRGTPITLSEYLSSPGQNYEAFLSTLFHYGLSENGIVTGDEQIGSILDQDLNPLGDQCALYLSENIRGNLVRHSKSAIRLRTQSGMDWFSLSFESDSLSPEEINFLLQAYRKKKKYVRVNGNYLAADDDELSRVLSEFSSQGEEEELTTQKLPLYQALNLRLEGGLKIEIDDQLQALFDSLLHFQNTKIDLDDHFSAVLRPYQKDGVKWLYTLAKNALGGILADDMGLGKTLEMISFLSLLKENRPTLIVAPKSLLYNWKSEFQKWDPERDVTVVEGAKAVRKKTIESMKEPKNGVYVVSYDSLRNDEELYEGVEFSTVVLDEAQSIANATARKTKAVKTLQAHHRFALTGTPIQNSYMDLWSIFDFLLPGYLDGFKQFQMIYGSLSDAKEAEIHRLEAQVAPFLLRRTKEEVLSDLPPKTEEVLIVSMEEAEEKLYAAYAQNAKLTLNQQKENKRDRVAILAALTRLRQLCVDPSSFLSNFHATSAKLNQTLSMVQEAISGGHKVLIFSSFVTVLHHLQSLLSGLKIESGLISGDVPAKDRLEMAERFNSEKGQSVMLVSLKAGGTGLNLIGADIVIHLDPWWNIAAENQASDRAHRIGQTRPVTVWKLVAKNTIEEKIIELQSLKRSLSSIIRVADEEGSSLTQDDIDFLLS